MAASESKSMENDDNTEATASEKDPNPPKWKREDCIYTSCYCEENVWKLCEQTVKENKNTADYFVIFLSNQSKQFPIWCAKSALQPDQPIIWDYHVIYLWINRSNPMKSLIFDLDTALQFPCPVGDYTLKSFRPQMNLKDNFKHNFRVLGCKQYLDTFYSDRMHMFQDNQWMSPPPKYPLIMIDGKKKGSNLMTHFVDITHSEIGTVFDDVMKMYKWITDSNK